MANTPSATVCAGKVCAHVKGDAAVFVNILAVIAAFVLFIAAVNKLLS